MENKNIYFSKFGPKNKVFGLIFSIFFLILSLYGFFKQLPVNDEQKNLSGIEKLNVPRSIIPAVTHIDYSARVQTVHEETNPRYHALISRFKHITGCPIIVNTSFNIRDEPIVCTPEDAFNCFMRTDLDMLIIGNSVLYKEKQPTKLLMTS